jgi:hypothetical protein
MPEYPPSANRRECKITLQLLAKLGNFSTLKNSVLKIAATPLLIIFYHLIPLLARLKLARQEFIENLFLVMDVSSAVFLQILRLF